MVRSGRPSRRPRPRGRPFGRRIRLRLQRRRPARAQRRHEAARTWLARRRRCAGAHLRLAARAARSCRGALPETSDIPAHAMWSDGKVSPEPLMHSGWLTPCTLGQRATTRAGQASGLSCSMNNCVGDPGHTEPASMRGRSSRRPILRPRQKRHSRQSMAWASRQLPAGFKPASSSNSRSRCSSRFRRRRGRVHGTSGGCA